jgi:hypothetical protein
MEGWKAQRQFDVLGECKDGLPDLRGLIKETSLQENSLYHAVGWQDRCRNKYCQMSSLEQRGPGVGSLYSLWCLVTAGQEFWLWYSLVIVPRVGGCGV